MTKMSVRAGVILLVFAGAIFAVEPEQIAARNASQASEAFLRSKRVMHAWLGRVDPVTGLLPRKGNDPNRVVKDSAADLYPFMVITAFYTDRELYHGLLRRTLADEVRLTTVPGGLVTAYDLSADSLVSRDIDRLIFGTSEYVKDGLVPVLVTLR